MVSETLDKGKVLSFFLKVLLPAMSFKLLNNKEFKGWFSI